MIISKEDIHIVRELAKRFVEVASLPVMEKTRQRMIENNDLNPGRPLVLISDVPWHEMDIDGKLKIRCTGDFTRDMEWYFRRTLFQWEYFPGDLYIENAYTIFKAYSSTGYGLVRLEDRLYTDERNGICSHRFIDQLQDESSIDRILVPVVTAYPEKDKEMVMLAEEILGGILKVELRGHQIFHEPWGDICHYHGMTQTMLDMVDRPTYMHRLVEHLTHAKEVELDQWEKLGLLECRDPYLHCTPSLTNDLPAKDYTSGESPRLKDVWFRTMAQVLADVSPDMHEEFELRYGKRLAERCGLTYYGCCEPLDNKISNIKSNYPNLRKLSVTPWANEERCAEQLRGDYVYARKPNPAYVAIATDPKLVHEETKKTVEICLKYGCPYELVLKDISTVSYHPENLIIWEKTVRDTLNRYY